MNRNEALRHFVKHIPKEVDAMIIRDQANRKYLTGFLSTAGTLFITHEEVYFFLDGRYYEAGKNQVKNCTVLLEENLEEQLRKLIVSHRIKIIALESSRISVEQAIRFQQCLAPAQVRFDGIAEDCLKRCREIKTKEEIEAIRGAQRIALAAFEHMLRFVRPGVSELELAVELGTFAARHGCERRAFSMIFTSGVKTALPHGAPPDRVLTSGDMVMVDMSCMVDGFFSDMTRTFCVGKADDEKKHIYQIVYEAQQKAIAAVGPGVVCSDVDRIARDVIIKTGYGEYYPHGLGHGIGAETHETPRFAPGWQNVLCSGNVLSVEPGIYLPNRFGIRIEDLLVVTSEGCEMLSQAPDELLEV